MGSVATNALIINTLRLTIRHLEHEMIVTPDDRS
jgi:hypothetical protein